METADAVQMPMKAVNNQSGLEQKVNPRKDGIGGLLDTVIDDVSSMFAGLGTVFENMVGSIFGRSDDYGWNANGKGNADPDYTLKQTDTPYNAYTPQMRYAN